MQDEDIKRKFNLLEEKIDELKKEIAILKPKKYKVGDKVWHYVVKGYNYVGSNYFYIILDLDDGHISEVISEDMMNDFKTCENNSK